MNNTGSYIANNYNIQVTPKQYNQPMDLAIDCKEKDLFKCDKCKSNPDELHSITIYHPKYHHCKDKNYCECCFNKVLN